MAAILFRSQRYLPRGLGLLLLPLDSAMLARGLMHTLLADTARGLRGNDNLLKTKTCRS